MAAHLGLGSLHRDQHSLDKALHHLNEAYVLTEELIKIADSPGLQDKLGVILTTQGEVLNKQSQFHMTGQTSLLGTHTALSKQQRAVKIFRQLEENTT